MMKFQKLINTLGSIENTIKTQSSSHTPIWFVEKNTWNRKSKTHTAQYLKLKLYQVAFFIAGYRCEMKSLVFQATILQWKDVPGQGQPRLMR